jgi:Virus neck protein.
MERTVQAQMAGEQIIQENDDTSFILSEESGTEFYLLTDTATTDADRPQEGDLVYHPILSRMFEISFVDHDDPFYQLDNNPVYKLRCKQYEYSHEEIDTGITTIDEIEGDLQQDALEHQFTLEQSSAVNEDIRIFHSANEQGLLLLDGTDSSSTNANDNVVMENDSTSVGESILLEGGGSDTEDASYLIQEDIVTGDYTSAGSQDKTAQNELFDSLDDDVLDFSESNPFGDAGGT